MRIKLLKKTDKVTGRSLNKGRELVVTNEWGKECISLGLAVKMDGLTVEEKTMEIVGDFINAEDDQPTKVKKVTKGKDK